MSSIQEVVPALGCLREKKSQVAARELTYPSPSHAISTISDYLGDAKRDMRCMFLRSTMLVDRYPRLDIYFVILQNYETMKRKKLGVRLQVHKALANDKRLLILEYLKDPIAHFPPQVDGDLIKDGVCANFIREKLHLSPATATQHLKILAGAGLVRGKRVKRWIFYKRCEDRVAELQEMLSREL